jgi:hypothetical protein
VSPPVTPGTDTATPLPPGSTTPPASGGFEGGSTGTNTGVADTPDVPFTSTGSAGGSQIPPGTTTPDGGTTTGSNGGSDGGSDSGSGSTIPASIYVYQYIGTQRCDGTAQSGAFTEGQCASGATTSSRLTCDGESLTIIKYNTTGCTGPNIGTVTRPLDKCISIGANSAYYQCVSSASTAAISSLLLMVLALAANKIGQLVM